MPTASESDEQVAAPEPLSLFDLDEPAPPTEAPPEPATPTESSPEPEVSPETTANDESPPEPAPNGAFGADHVPRDDPPIGDLLNGIVGQQSAVERLRAALSSPLPSYLFVGPAGADLRGAACRFAGELLAARSSTPERERRLALAQSHPDLVIFDRVGVALTAEQAREAVSTAATAPATGDVKVVLLADVDRAAQSAPILLKSVEEPPPSTVFVLLAAEINRAMETLASRCVRVDFEALSEDELQELLIVEGIERGRAEFAAVAADGSVDRARMLARDDSAAARIEMWQTLRSSLNGSGSTALAAGEAALEAIEQAVAPLEAHHEAERVQADEQAEAYGTNVGRSSLDERHRRALRRVRSDEFAMGLSVLAAQIRSESASGYLPLDVAGAQLEAISDAAEALRYNANQRLALNHLFIRLGRSRTVR